MFEYITSGVCARKIALDIEDNILKDIEFIGGCEGNLQGISSLVRGMQVEEVIEKLSGIKCGRKSTSCPDQLTKALKTLKSLEQVG
ncbi:TIGR03905 family TSCPD domain-containing protein [Irregularibacter muris]|uniref:ribonucleoside-diphosphate reductase n=1 Tax=Irregularibacter muris TaxID=1796619 RepID=A0AAE3KYQ5_9FIRM|nr:TIGR03905 family TSCPD domain-containing protein [Irregularibacter muris]MCR1897391.1 TIGR03905 family TSCPD domain-containing protein [Irregularibacter muris]